MDILRFYTGQRRIYPYIFGAAIWLAWLIGVLLGPGNFDLGGKVIGTDYLMFYTAGQTLADGQQVDLYDFEAQSARQEQIIGPELEDFFAYINFPFLAWLYVPFASLSYVWSFVLWSIMGLLLLWLSLRFLGNSAILPLALTFVPVFTNFSFGQNAFVSLFLLSAVYSLWKQDKRLLAGILLAFLLYKPQLVMGVGLLWLLNIRKDWQSLAGFAIGTGIVATIMFLFMPDATAAYFVFAQETLPKLAELGEFPIWHMHHPRGFWQLLLPATVADILWIVGNLFGIYCFWRLWQAAGQAETQNDKPYWFAAAVLLTLWTTPHAMIYDWSLLLIPAVLLWHARPQWHNQLLRLFIWGWLAYMFSTALTAGMLAISTIAVQVSVIFFAFACWSLFTLSKTER